MNAIRVVSIGDLVTDLVTEIPHLPAAAGQHQVASKVQLEPGGAGNFLIAGARLGMAMTALGTVGDDWSGQALLAALQAEGVDTHSVSAQGSTTTVVSLVAADGGGHVFLGAYGQGSEVPLLPAWSAAVASAQAVIGWGYTLHETRVRAAMLAGMAQARQQGLPVFFDPGPFFASAESAHQQAALERTSVLLLTDEELPSVSPQGGSEEARVGALLARGLSGVVVKRGPHGCSIFTAQERADHPGFAVPVVDTSAAGDSFAAALIFGWLSGWPLARTAAFANAMGAAKVQKMGSGRQVPTRAEVDAVLLGHS